MSERRRVYLWMNRMNAMRRMNKFNWLRREPPPPPFPFCLWYLYYIFNICVVDKLNYMLDFYQLRDASREEKKELHLASWILIARIFDELFKLRVYKFCKYRYYCWCFQERLVGNLKLWMGSWEGMNGAHMQHNPRMNGSIPIRFLFPGIHS